MNKSILEDLVSKGYSQREIADKLSTSQTTIRYWLVKHDLKTVKVFKCSCGETEPERFTKGRYTQCRRCRNKHQINLFRKYKRQAVSFKGGKCSICGYAKCLAGLDFHHEDPTQKDPKWKTMRNWSFEKVKQELDKCILVCRNCHSEIHYGSLDI